MFLEIKKEIKKLREICREKEVIDVVPLGCAGKEKTSNISLAIVFRGGSSYNKNIILKINSIFNKKNVKANIIPLPADDLLKGPLFLDLVQNGFSIKNNKLVSKMLNVETIVLLTYDLKILNHSRKTLFGYALKGRKGQKGFLDSLKGSAVGRNNVLIPINMLDELKEFFETWHVRYSIQKFMRINERG